jgi:hypothetical protein
MTWLNNKRGRRNSFLFDHLFITGNQDSDLFFIPPERGQKTEIAPSCEGFIRRRWGSMVPGVVNKAVIRYEMPKPKPSLRGM